MSYRRQNQQLFLYFFAAILILTGCAPQLRQPEWICPGKQSVDEWMNFLNQRLENTTPLKANGRCRLQYYAEGKPRKENFPVKLWFNPPAQIRLQGDVAFDPKGIVLGSNEDEFWLSIKPKEVSSYWWGRWSEESCPEKLVISPELVLEALGIVEVYGGKNWSLSKEGVFDVLTKRDGRAETQKIYIHSCNYLVRRIEYFEAGGEAVIFTELGKYREVSKGFFVPTLIKIVNRAQEKGENSVRITLESVKSVNFTEKQQRRLFTRRKPRGFKHVFRIVGEELVEQPP